MGRCFQIQGIGSNEGARSTRSYRCGRATTAHILGRPPSNEPRTPGRELVRLVPRLASRRIVRAPRRARAVRFLSAGTAATAG